MKSFVKVWFQHWLERRTPPKESVQLGHNNIYILPTGEGLLFLSLMVVMLLTAINYQNSLIYMLTFLLGCLMTATILHTYKNLNGLLITITESGEGALGTDIPFRVVVSSVEHYARPAILLRMGEGAPICLMMKADAGELSLSRKAEKRGWVDADWIRVETVFPFGFFRAWSWFRPKAAGVAWPLSLMAPAVSAGSSSAGNSDTPNRQKSGQEELSELRGYRQGDSMSHVLWKRANDLRPLQVRTFDSPVIDPDWLDIDGFSSGDIELRLSWITYLVNQRFQEASPWGLRLKDQVFGPDEGIEFHRKCLRALALYGLNDQRAQ